MLREVNRIRWNAVVHNEFRFATRAEMMANSNRCFSVFTADLVTETGNLHSAKSADPWHASCNSTLTLFIHQGTKGVFNVGTFA